MLSFDRVVADYGPGLARIAASYERNPALREELLQEILLAVYGSLPKLEDDTKVKPFVFRIAHNRCVDHVTKHAGSPVMQALSVELPDGDPTPEQALLDGERARNLAAAVARLDLPYRQAISLLLEGFTYKEIAETLGISISNVGVRVNRAKSKLTTLLRYER